MKATLQIDNGAAQQHRPTIRAVPVVFIPGRVAVNEAGAMEMLDLLNGRSLRGAKAAFLRFRERNKIKKLPGGVFSVKQIERAAHAEMTNS